jgi:hypothetical protein
MSSGGVLSRSSRSALCASCSRDWWMVMYRHTSAYVSNVSIRQHASHLVDGDVLALERCESRQRVSVGIYRHTSAYVSIRQHTSACVSIHQRCESRQRVSVGTRCTYRTSFFPLFRKKGEKKPRMLHMRQRIRSIRGPSLGSEYLWVRGCRWRRGYEDARYIVGFGREVCSSMRTGEPVHKPVDTGAQASRY